MTTMQGLQRLGRICKGVLRLVKLLALIPVAGFALLTIPPRQAAWMATAATLFIVLMLALRLRQMISTLRTSRLSSGKSGSGTTETTEAEPDA